MKKALITASVLVMTATMRITCSAAGWQQNETGYWYQNGNGTWPANTWQWIDGNQDGVAECYYFDRNGYMLSNTITPDGYIVNADGAWVVNGALQTQSFIVNGICYNVGSNGVISNDKDVIDSPSESTGTEAYAKEVLQIVNQERQAAGKAPLEWDDELSICAAERAKELVEKFSHTRPDGSSCFTILKENGIQYLTAGENIAMGQTSPEQVMNSWMNSTGHKNNILSSSYGKIGVGCYYADGRYYWVQMFTN